MMRRRLGTPTPHPTAGTVKHRLSCHASFRLFPPKTQETDPMDNWTLGRLALKGNAQFLCHALILHWSNAMGGMMGLLAARSHLSRTRQSLSSSSSPRCPLPRADRAPCSHPPPRIQPNIINHNVCANITHLSLPAVRPFPKHSPLLSSLWITLRGQLLSINVVVALTSINYKLLAKPWWLL